MQGVANSRSKRSAPFESLLLSRVHPTREGRLLFRVEIRKGVDWPASTAVVGQWSKPSGGRITQGVASRAKLATVALVYEGHLARCSRSCRWVPCTIYVYSKSVILLVLSRRFNRRGGVLMTFSWRDDQYFVGLP